MGAQLKFVIIGDRQSERALVSFFLRSVHKFKVVRIGDPISRFIRYQFKIAYNHKIDKKLKGKIYHALYEVDPDMHINHLMWRLSQTTTDRVVVDDIFYLNELRRLVDDGFKVIRISGKPRQKPPKDLDERSILIYEMFGKELNKYKVDYSIVHTSRNATKQALNRIVENELTKLDKS